MNAQCHICDELRQKPTSRFAELMRTQGILNATLVTTKSLAVLPSIGPLVSGHCIVTPLNHVNNVLVWAAHENVLPEIARCLARISQAFLGPDDVLLIAEHGATTDKVWNNLCSTVHGHLHAVPLHRTIAEKVLQHLGVPNKSSTFGELAQTLQEHEEYGVAAIFTNNGLITDARLIEKNALESQLIRKTIGSVAGISSWDWHSVPGEKILQHMLARDFKINSFSM